MKKKLCYIAVLASIIGCASLSQASTYTMDFDAAVARTSATGIFDIDAFAAIDAASLDFVIRGKTTSVNSRGDWWYYDPNIDVSIAGTQVLDNYHLSGDFTVLHFDLTAAALSYMETNQSLNFQILAQDGYWWSDLSPWGGYTKAPFYLDGVSLQVTPSAVPIPGTVFLLGSGLAGLIGAGRRRRK
ncbi:MAG: VPLPA-CTERM sorting domain-containing protein [Proteobacteria bacterium]|nr:VPLPA-CTERM sorting domain-containing protein [Pseudomonadota bacterium]MBU4295220.1 VPLPA-CTERM sorting domain-containing protein [Pseudomonadota bacterium]MCG2750154.1 VPLPA-CTERM sorting domain-containing protein [Desulfobulbaceae bacterium]